MILWRISRHLDLSGAGGLKAAGRWHHAGHLIVYLAENPAGALLEVCAHTSANDIPPDFTLLRIEGPDVKLPYIEISDMPEDWRLRLEVTRDLGTTWLEKNESALIKVPSALVPATANFLLNPVHPNAKQFHITEMSLHLFDIRLKT
jgi:RES domain-containing protein